MLNSADVLLSAALKELKIAPTITAAKKPTSGAGNKSKTNLPYAWSALTP